MLEGMTKKIGLSGTKAETLYNLAKQGYNIPPLFFFSVDEWDKNSKRLINKIIKKFSDVLVAVRSSAVAEDLEDSSMAGAFVSILNVKTDPENLDSAIQKVIASYDGNPHNQILVQPMVQNVAMSGVVMTQVLDDGSPYHVINYDDSTGLTDTVTNGLAINKTVFIYNGVEKKDFDSPYLLTVLHLIRDLQNTFPNIPLDIEFAIDKNGVPHLLQVRNITTINNWNKNITDQVSTRMLFLEYYVEKITSARPHLYGKRTLLGFMPDWNPAEMIGVVPRPLAMSLYRELITKSTWRIAREKMGYRKMPNVDLMVSLFGRVYIDVRNSMNSFLPDGLDDLISEKIINAYLDRLDQNPHLHDKIEFEVVHTVYDFDFDEKFNERYPKLLGNEEFIKYKGLLRNITREALSNRPDSSINKALRDIKKLKSIQEIDLHSEFENNSYSIADKINTLISECIEFGTIPFSILARHAFIAEALLRSAVNKKVIKKKRITEFRRSIVTVAGEMSKDFFAVLTSDLGKEEYLKKYGHLRPSSYDILSPNYANRKNLFENASQRAHNESKKFELTNKEKTDLNILLGEHGIDGITAVDLFSYAKKAIKGREYSKFIFTRHLSSILEYVAEWGKIKGFDRSDMAMLAIDDILSILFAPLTNDIKSFYQQKINEAKNNFEVAKSFKLSYLIRSVRDVYIVPMQRSAPNFVGHQRLEAEIVELTPYSKTIPALENKIICIEGADPGYDWIFTRNIAGLVTKYGGTNSHMAIRCTEYNIPAAIGCGEQPYERILKSRICLLDCESKRLEPIF